MTIRLYAVDTENKNMTWIAGLLIPATQEQIDEAAGVAELKDKMYEARSAALKASIDLMEAQAQVADLRTQRDKLLAAARHITVYLDSPWSYDSADLALTRQELELAIVACKPAEASACIMMCAK